MPESDPVHHPNHYTWHPSGVECKEIAQEFPFNLGAAIKYIWRAGRKGPAIRDLEKAQESIANEIERLKLRQASAQEKAKPVQGFVDLI